MLAGGNSRVVEWAKCKLAVVGLAPYFYFDSASFNTRLTDRSHSFPSTTEFINKQQEAGQPPSLTPPRDLKEVYYNLFFLNIWPDCSLSIDLQVGKNWFSNRTN